MMPPRGLVGGGVSGDVRWRSRRLLPGDYVEQAEHTRPSTCAGLAEVGEVLEVVGCDVAVDGELAVDCQSSSARTQKQEKLTLQKNKYTCSSGTPSATRK
jgi:hypothetical protein